jgi:hypothetical protein
VAVATAVVLLAAGGLYVRTWATRAPDPATTSDEGRVPWAPLPPTGVQVPTVTQSAEPDPGVAAGLPACTADTLSVTTVHNGAMGTRYLAADITSTTRCRLSGHPSVVALDAQGATLDVPVEPATAPYGHPVAVGGGATAKLVLGWSSAWCADPISIAALRLVLPEGGGVLTTDGLGDSACNADPGSGQKSPIRVSDFAPTQFVAPADVSVFAGTRATGLLPAAVGAGGQFGFVVVLTAATDVPLDVCPDYSIRLGDVRDQIEEEYALNCTAVPHRDSAGRPFLPAGIPVTFNMRVSAPRVADTAAKLIWQLMVPEPVVAGGTVEVQP